jgi:hypothetical protein
MLMSSGLHHIRPVVREGADTRATLGRSLTRLLLALGGTVAGAALVASVVPVRPFEATVRMEQLARQMERARVLAPETIATVNRLMSHPSYDCRQVPCRLELQQRNRAARDRLHAVLSAAGAPIHDASSLRSDAHAAQQERF